MRRIAKVILVNGGRFLLQQRDSDVERYPSVWTLFGGNVDEGETPKGTLRRELLEELGYELGAVEFLFTKIRMQDDEEVEDNIFFGEVSEDILNRKLLEGQGMKFIGIDELDDYDIFPAFKKYILEYSEKD